MPVWPDRAVVEDQLLQVNALSNCEAEVVPMEILDLEQMEGDEIVRVQAEEVHHRLVYRPTLVVEPEQAEAGQNSQAFEIVEESRVQGQPFHVRTQLGHQFKVVRRQELHRVEEHRL